MTYSVGTAPKDGLVLIYQDKGTSHESCTGLFTHLCRHFRHSEIKFADSNYLNTNEWPNRVSLLVFPGGACTPWEKNLGPEGVLKIKRYVEEYRGRILGICAGAYFLAKISDYTTESISIHRIRDISLFPGIAAGPLLFNERPMSAPPTDHRMSSIYRSSLEARSFPSFPSSLSDGDLPSILTTPRRISPPTPVVKLCFTSDETIGHYPYLGGPGLTSDKKVTVIATYPDSPGSPIATLGFNPDEGGSLVACSPHPELTNPDEPNQLLAEIIDFLFGRIEGSGSEAHDHLRTFFRDEAEDDAHTVDFS
jgi:glutamine amidotransferase-like uncharacterized protein